MKSHLENQSKSGRFSSFPFNHNGENWGRISQDVCKTSYIQCFWQLLWLLWLLLFFWLFIFQSWNPFAFDTFLLFCKERKKKGCVTVKIRKTSKNHASFTSLSIHYCEIHICFVEQLDFLRRSRWRTTAVFLLLFGLDPQRPHF